MLLETYTTMTVDELRQKLPSFLNIGKKKDLIIYCMQERNLETGKQDICVKAAFA